MVDEDNVIDDDEVERVHRRGATDADNASLHRQLLAAIAEADTLRAELANDREIFNALHEVFGYAPDDFVDLVTFVTEDVANLHAELAQVRAERDAAAKWIGVVGAELVNAGMPSGDRDVTLANVRELVRELAASRARVDALMAEHEVVRAECAKFRFPDEDRPGIWDAHQAVEAALQPTTDRENTQ